MNTIRLSYLLLAAALWIAMPFAYAESTNTPPEANAGPAQTIFFGQPVYVHIS